MQYLKFVFLAAPFPQEPKPVALSSFLHFCEHLFSLISGVPHLLLYAFQTISGRQFVAFAVFSHNGVNGMV